MVAWAAPWQNCSAKSSLCPCCASASETRLPKLDLTSLSSIVSAWESRTLSVKLKRPSPRSVEYR